MQDQAQKSATATQANAQSAGVQDRITVQTADMRDLPFPADQFDIALSAWAVHNIPDDTGRKSALADMMRVLKPGGQIILTDIAGRNVYRDVLRDLGAVAVAVVVLHPLKDRIVAARSLGSFAPFTVLARKVGQDPPDNQPKTQKGAGSPAPHNDAHSQRLT